jgi:dipeptidyl aminopeptidase/acylaminoacyl peptidase
MHSWLRLRSLVVSGAAILAFVAVPRFLLAQAPVKRPLSYDTYDYWRSISGTRLSHDGEWLAYGLSSQGEDGDLVVRNLKTGKDYHAARGSSPTFTPDGRLAIFTIAQPKADELRAAGASSAEEPATPQAPGRAGGPSAAQTSMGIMTLADGKVTTIDRVAQFRLPDESSTWLAYHRPSATGRGAGGGRAGAAGAGRGGAARGATGGAQPAATPSAAGGESAPEGTAPEKRKDPGSELVVRNLATGEEMTIAEVTDFQWNKDGSFLAYAVSSAKPEGDGAFVRKLADESTVTLHQGKGHYSNLAFDEAGRQLAFLSDAAEYEKKVSPYRLYYWKAGDPTATELVSAATKGMPPGMAVSEYGGARFSDDGARLYLGTAPPPPPPADPKAPKPIQVDLWNYHDLELQPMQQVRAQQARQRNFRAVVQLADRRFVELASPDLPTVNPGTDAIRAIGLSDLPYEQEISWDTTYDDVALVDQRTGARRKILEHFHGNASLSPGGSYVLYFDDKAGQWVTYHIADGTRTVLTDRLPVKFFLENHDTPDLPGAYGVAGWTEADRSVLLYDQFDIWEVRPDGSGAHMVTSGEGRKQHLVFRYRPIESDDTAAGRGGRGGGAAVAPISAAKPLFLSATNDDSRASGFYRVPLTGTAAPEKVMMVDKQVGVPIKAKDADVVVFTEQRFDEFPDLWVSDSGFRAPQKVSNANPQQADYTWGKAEKIEYTNTDGRKLDALLIKPDNFDPSKKYPLIVYIYEELSAGLHGYRAPAPGTSINVTRYVSNGYIVLEPDIVYGTGHPGQDAMKCVLPAIHAVTEKGFIDEKRIGIQGHSWGGYQIAYMVSHTDVFAAVEAGAAVADMISAYGGIRWGTGMVREFQYEKTQSRIGSTPWDDPLDFIESSPIFAVKNVHTPYLTIANDADDAVPWYQGIEFFTAMRRLGKEAYMFSFNGQPHGLRDRDDMKYWTVHMDEFFDHYLLGKPKPDWMDKGVPYIEKGTRDVLSLFKRPLNPPAPVSTGGGGQ